ncbi:MAG: hypothetical protein QOI54_1016 [Actinomycetota bacterium]|nr:hypothetical protein [Actinomycetota bacterium]
MTDAPPREDSDTARARALIEEAAKKSAMLWLRPAGGTADVPAQAAWHVWADGAAYVVTGGLEQKIDCLVGLDADASLIVTVRSKDTGGRLVTWPARVRRITPADGTWEPVVAALHGKRLNAPDGEAQPGRWARESVVHRIEPTGELIEGPGHTTTGSHAAPPPSCPATTRGRLPFMVGRRARRRR